MKEPSIVPGAGFQNFQISPSSVQKNTEEHTILKRTLIKHISHDIQGGFFSVASVAAMAKLACEKGEDATVFLEHLLDACQSFKHKLSNFVEYSRYDAGMKDIRFGPMDLRQLLDRVKRETETYAIEEQVKITFYLSDDLPAEVQSDDLKLFVVCTNLLNTAIGSSSKISPLDVRINREDSKSWSLAIEFSATDLIWNVCRNLFNSQGVENTVSGNNIRLNLIVSRYVVEDILGGKMLISRQGEIAVFKIVLPFDLQRNVPVFQSAADGSFGNGRV